MSPIRTLLSVASRVLLVALVLAMPLVVASPASAAVVVERAQLDGTTLRLEGRALANRTITVDGVGMATSDSSGRFRVSRSS